MSEIRLTKDSDALICVLYKEYLQRRKDGQPKTEAKFFGGASYIQQNFLPKWSEPDVAETCRELSRKEFLSCQDADNTVWIAVLTDEAIIYMENRFKDGFTEVLDYLEKIKSILLW